MRSVDQVTPEEILSFWFPDDLSEAVPEAIEAFYQSRMHGGMDDAICRDYPEVTRAAAEGRLDKWAETSHGRLALILVLDQFPRSLWRDTPVAFGQDIKATRLALEGLENGHYNSLTHIVQRQFYIICIAHCEGPDHLERMDLCLRLTREFADIAKDDQKDLIERARAQAERVRNIIVRFGRHPHRNPIFGRVSSPEELAYIETGDFPHVRKNA